MVDFVNEVEALLLANGDLERVPSFFESPIKAVVNLTPKERLVRGRIVDFHLRLPQGLMDDLEAIAKVYPRPRNTLIRVFLDLAVKQWELDRQQAAKQMAPKVEAVRKRKLGEGRNK